MTAVLDGRTETNFWGRLMSRMFGGTARKNRSHMSQRRRRVRLPVAGHNITCWCGNSRLVGVIVDISMEGMRISTSRPLTVGAVLEIQLDGGGSTVYRVGARVAWVSSMVGRAELGVVFVERPEILQRSWVYPLVCAAGGATPERRATRRVPTRLRAAIYSQGDVRSIDGRLLDLGEGGALLETSHSMHPGEKVRIASDGGLNIQASVLRSICDEDGHFLSNVIFLDSESVEKKSLNSVLRRLTQR